MKGRQIITVWLAIYPIITLLNYFLSPYLKDLPLPIGTFVTTIIVVPLMVHGGIPLSHHIVHAAIKIFKKTSY